MEDKVIFTNEPDPDRILQALSLCWKIKTEKETGAAVTAAASFITGGNEKTA